MNHITFFFFIITNIITTIIPTPAVPPTAPPTTAPTFIVAGSFSSPFCSGFSATPSAGISSVLVQPYDENSFNAIKIHNLKYNLQNIPLFYGRGAWDESKMHFVDRALCKMLQKIVIKKDPSTYEQWETALVEAIGKTCDWTDKK